MATRRFSPPESMWQGFFRQVEDARHAESLLHAIVDFTGGKTQVLRAEGHILPDRFADDLAVGVLEDHSHPPHHFAGRAGPHRCRSLKRNPRQVSKDRSCVG